MESRPFCQNSADLRESGEEMRKEISADELIKHIGTLNKNK